MPGHISKEWVEKGASAFFAMVPSAYPCLDFANTISIDSAGISFLLFLGKKSADHGKKLVLKNLPSHIKKTIETAHIAKKNLLVLQKKENAFVRVGSAILTGKQKVELGLSMLAELLYWATFGLLKRRDFRKGVFEQQMFLMGYKAFGIVALLSFLIGMVLALQAALQLEKFGAGIFLAPMITISMIKELGPLLCAIIITGRSGSAITAEIATMVVGEEIDALRTMGINPLQFVAVPKLFALSVTMPILSLFASLVGVVAGFLVAVTYLDISINLMIGEIIKNIYFHDVIANVIKSVVFSWLIVWIGSFHGFRVHGGAEAVGRETTQSVVNGIFIIICADAIFSFVF